MSLSMVDVEPQLQVIDSPHIAVALGPREVSKVDPFCPCSLTLEYLGVWIARVGKNTFDLRDLSPA